MKNHLKTDEVLFKDFLSCNSEALYQLLQKYYTEIISISLKHLSSLDHSEDFIQDLMIMLITKKGKLTGVKKVKLWLLDLVRKRAIDYFRKAKSGIGGRQILIGDQDRLDSFADEKIPLEEFEEKPEELQILNSNIKDLRKCLNKLAQEDAIFFERCLEEEMKNSAALQKEFNLTTRELTVRKQRIKRNLKRCIINFRKTQPES